MKRDYLRGLFKDLSLEQSVVDKLVDELADSSAKELESVRKPDLSAYVAKEDYENLSKEFNEFKETNKEILEKYPTLENEYNSLKESATKELDNFKLNQFIEKELASKKVKNNTALKAILKEKGFEFSLNEKKDGIDVEAFNRAFDEAIKGNEYLIDTGDSSHARSGLQPGYSGSGTGNVETPSISNAIKGFYQN